MSKDVLKISKYLQKTTCARDCFPVNSAKYLGISFLWNTSGRLPLPPTPVDKAYNFIKKESLAQVQNFQEQRFYRTRLAAGSITFQSLCP